MKQVLFFIMFVFGVSFSCYAEDVHIEDIELKLENYYNGESVLLFSSEDDLFIKQSWYIVDIEDAEKTKDSKIRTKFSLYAEITDPFGYKKVVALIVPFTLPGQETNENINTFLNDLSKYAQMDRSIWKPVTSKAKIMLEWDNGDKECRGSLTELGYMQMRGEILSSNIDLGLKSPLIQTACGNYRESYIGTTIIPYDFLRMKKVLSIFMAL